MQFGRIFQISQESLGAHRMRTFLTMLGVIIGVAAVISMLSIGEGAQLEVLKQIEILGINNIIVQARIPEQEAGSQEGFQRSSGLSLADGVNIGRFDDLITNIVPQRFEPFPSIQAGREEAQVRVVATFSNFTISSSIEVEYGRFLIKSDEESFAQVCVLGAKAKRNLFAFEEAIGRTVRISDLDFVVVGVMSDKYIGRGKVEGLELKNFNEDVYIPYSTALKKFDRQEPNVQSRPWMRHQSGSSEVTYNVPEIDQLTVSVADVELVGVVSKLIDRILKRRHGGVEDFEIVVPESLLRQSQKTQQIFNIVMGAIAGLSLLVGGIGIMNIMLASVLERTREIGIRRAAGATQNDIMRQFLFEAVSICLIGCAVGVILGLLIAQAISFYAGWPTIVSLFSIILAIGVSTTVGVIFGFFPARQAARLNVIDALRYE